MQQYGDLTGQIPPNLGDADAAMQQSAEALASGQDSNAADAQQRAIEALQKGGREMSQQMARQFGRGQQPGSEGEEGDQDGQNGQGQMTGSDTGGDQYGDAPDGSPRDGSRSANRQGDQRDPLGRRLPPGTSGAVDNGDVQVPDEMEAARSRAMQEELRRRGADRTRPQPESDYTGRYWSSSDQGTQWKPDWRIKAPVRLPCRLSLDRLMGRDGRDIDDLADRCIHRHDLHRHGSCRSAAARSSCRRPDGAPGGR